MRCFHCSRLTLGPHHEMALGNLQIFFQTSTPWRLWSKPQDGTLPMSQLRTTKWEGLHRLMGLCPSFSIVIPKVNLHAMVLHNLWSYFSVSDLKCTSSINHSMFSSYSSTKLCMYKIYPKHFMNPSVIFLIRYDESRRCTRTKTVPHI